MSSRSPRSKYRRLPVSRYAIAKCEMRYSALRETPSNRRPFWTRSRTGSPSSASACAITRLAAQAFSAPSSGRSALTRSKSSSNANSRGCGSFAASATAFSNKGEAANEKCDMAIIPIVIVNTRFIAAIPVDPQPAEHIRAENLGQKISASFSPCPSCCRKPQFPMAPTCSRPARHARCSLRP